MNDILLVTISAVSAYLLGSFSTAVVVSRALLGQDIRQLGSKSAGFTNALRVLSKPWAFAVFAGDLLKGAVAVTLAWFLLDGSQYQDLGRAVAALCVLLGHAYPVFFGFRGGKGVATTAAVVLVFDWRVGLLCISVYIIVLALTRFSSLGSISAAVSLPLVMLLFRPGEWLTIGVVTVMTVLLLVWHHANISRLLKGTEPKMNFSKKPDSNNKK